MEEPTIIVSVQGPYREKQELLDKVREEIRKRHYSLRTEEAYIAWVRRFVQFHGFRPMEGMNEGDIENSPPHLAVSCEVAPATQNQALGALLFLFRDVLRIRLDWLDDVVRAKKPKRLPVVLTRQEVQTVMTHLFSLKWIAAMLLYGAGLRLMECLQLRVKDIDYGYRQITVRGGKGNRDRITALPAAVEPRLRNHLEEIRQQHEEDLKNNGGYVRLPSALAGKISRGRPGMGLAMGVFVAPSVQGKRYGPHLSAPPLRNRPSKSNSRCGHPFPHPQTDFLPHIAAFFRDASTRRWVRHPDYPGTARPSRRQHNDDLHTRPEPGRTVCP